MDLPQGPAFAALQRRVSASNQGKDHEVSKLPEEADGRDTETGVEVMPQGPAFAALQGKVATSAVQHGRDTEKNLAVSAEAKPAEAPKEETKLPARKPPSRALSLGPLGSLVCSLSNNPGGGSEQSWAVDNQKQMDNGRAIRNELFATKKRGVHAQAPGGNYTPRDNDPVVLSANRILEDKLKKQKEREKNIAKELAQIMKYMEQSSFQLKKSNVELQRLSGQLWAYMTVVQQRVNLRSKRPLEESVKDGFQDALEREHATLLKEYEELAKHIDEGSALQKFVDDGVAEMQANKLTLHLDRTPFPYQFLQSMTDLEASVRANVVKASAACSSALEKKEKAHASTEKAMKTRIAQLDQMKKQFELEVKQSNFAIGVARNDLRKMTKLLKEKENQAENKIAESAAVDFATFNKRAKLSFEVLSGVRAKIKASAYTGHAGRQLDVVFSRYDTDGSGELSEDELRKSLRRALKIPPSVITDAEVSGLFATLDADESGSISIAEIVDFLNADIDLDALRKTHADTEDLLDKLEETHKMLVQRMQAVANAWKLDRECLTVTPIKGRQLDTLQAKPDKADPNKNKKPLEPRVQERVRNKIQQAAYSGGERTMEQLQELFNQFDEDGSGQLDDDEVRRALRFTLKIPSYSISDAEISSLCAGLDADGSGEISISEIMDFIGPEPEVNKAMGNVVKKSVRLKGGQRVFEGSAEHKEAESKGLIENSKPAKVTKKKKQKTKHLKEAENSKPAKVTKKKNKILMMHQTRNQNSSTLLMVAKTEIFYY